MLPESWLIAHILHKHCVLTSFLLCLLVFVSIWVAAWVSRRQNSLKKRCITGRLMCCKLLISEVNPQVSHEPMWKVDLLKYPLRRGSTKKDFYTALKDLLWLSALIQTATCLLDFFSFFHFVYKLFADYGKCQLLLVNNIFPELKHKTSVINVTKVNKKPWLSYWIIVYRFS